MNESKETTITKRYVYNNYSLQVVTENPNHEWNRDSGTSSFGPLEPWTDTLQKINMKH